MHLLRASLKWRRHLVVLAHLLSAARVGVVPQRATRRTPLEIGVDKPGRSFRQARALSSIPEADQSRLPDGASERLVDAWTSRVAQPS